MSDERKLTMSSSELSVTVKRRDCMIGNYPDVSMRDIIELIEIICR